MSQPVASSPVVEFGSVVTFEQNANGLSQTFTLVNPPESNPLKGLLSVESPVARALIGLHVGETATARLPKGEQNYLITAIA